MVTLKYLQCVLLISSFVPLCYHHAAQQLHLADTLLSFWDKMQAREGKILITCVYVLTENATVWEKPVSVLSGIKKQIKNLSDSTAVKKLKLDLSLLESFLESTLSAPKHPKAGDSWNWWWTIKCEVKLNYLTSLGFLELRQLTGYHYARLCMLNRHS